MSLLQNIQNMLGSGLAGTDGGKGGNIASNLPGLSGLLGPAALGGLAGLLLTSKTARNTAAGALLAGGGALLWNKYKNRMQAADNRVSGAMDNGTSGAMEPAKRPSPPDQRAERLIRAMVFAAKSDGHIDEKEEQLIGEKLQNLNLGADAEQIVQKAMREPIDPARLAAEVKNPEEALELYALSCAVIDPDHFMERSYLDALGEALRIPADVRRELMAKTGN